MGRRAIGVFDSGLGGLTVLAAMRRHLPREDFIYLGDTARVPYGTKSQDSVTQYALQVAARLEREDIKMLVVACNTVSAVALPAIQAAFPHLPVIGVVEPGAQRALAVSRSRQIGVIATEGTVERGAYTEAMHRQDASVAVYSRACTLFVSLVEEGWVKGELVTAIVREYLSTLTAEAPALDTLVLGCTHYPVLRPVIGDVMGSKVTLVDSADTTADAVVSLLAEQDLAVADDQPGQLRLWVTDGPGRFARVAGTFFGEPVDPDDVSLIDL